MSSLEFSKGYMYITYGGSTFSPVEGEVHKVMNNWDTAKFLLKETLTGLTLGNTIQIYFDRGGTINSYEFKGEVLSRTEKKEGKDITGWDFDAYGIFYESNKRITQIGSQKIGNVTFLQSLVDKIGALDSTFYFSEETIPIKGRGLQYVSDAIIDTCKDNSINFYTDTGGTVHFFVGDKGTSGVSLSFLVSKEHEEAINQLRNSITIYGEKAPFETGDSYCESTVRWTFKYYARGDVGWTTGTLETSTVNPYRGSVHLRAGYPGVPVEWLQMWISRPLDSSISLQNDLLKMNMNWQFIFGRQPAIIAAPPVGIKIYLSSVDITNAVPTDTIPYLVASISTSGQGGSPTTFDWNKIEYLITSQGGSLHSISPFSMNLNLTGFKYIGIHFHENPSKAVGSGRDKMTLCFDNLFFDRLVSVTYANTTSVDQWGAREYLPTKYFYSGLTTLELAAVCVKELSQFTIPEESIRDLELEGTYGISLGTRYTITFDNAVRSYQVKEIIQRYDGSDWKTHLVLASSPVRNPVRERAEIIKDLTKEVVTLKRSKELSDSELYMIGRIAQSPMIWNVGDLSYYSGTMDVENLRINVASGSSFTINKIDNIENFSAGTITSIGSITNINYMNVSTIGQIASINTVGFLSVGTISTVGVLNANVANISQINSVAVFTAGIVNADVLGSIGTATIGILISNQINGINSLSVGILNANTLGSIGTATITNLWSNSIGGIGTLTLTNLFATNASIGVISSTLSNLNIITAVISTINSVQNLNVMNASINVITNTLSNLNVKTANINTISSVQNLNAVNASINAITSTLSNLNAITANINTISNVNNLVALNITVNGTVTAGAGTIVNIYGTSINYNVGTITNFLAGTISGNSLSFNVGTINSFLAGTIGGNSIKFNIGTITNFQAGTISGNSLTFNIGTMTNMQVGTIGGNSAQFNIGTITNFQAGSISGNSIRFNIGTITSFQAGTISGNSLSFNIGTLTNMLVGTISGNSIRFNIGSINVILMQSATINNIDLNAGTIDNVLFQNSTINFTNITNTGNLVIGSSSISTLSLISIASNNVIQNSNINTLTITYDRLVKPPVGWNEIINPGFEYGMWQLLSGTNWDRSSGIAYAKSGKYCAEKYSASSISCQNVSNLICTTGKDSFVVSGWMRGTMGASGHYASMFILGCNSNSVPVWSDDWAILNYGSPKAAYTLYAATYPVSYPFYKVGINFQGQGEVFIDDISFVFGNQYTSFVDNTTARDRWMPDFQYGFWSNTLAITSGTTLNIGTIIWTQDYRGVGIIWFGAEYFTTTYTLQEIGVKFGLSIDGTPITHVWSTDYSKASISVERPINWLWTNTFEPGSHTIITYMYPEDANVQVKDRYIRMILGSCFG